MRRCLDHRWRMVDERLPRRHPHRRAFGFRGPGPPRLPAQPRPPRRLGQQRRPAVGRHHRTDAGPLRRAHRTRRIGQPHRHPARGRDGPCQRVHPGTRCRNPRRRPAGRTVLPAFLRRDRVAGGNPWRLRRLLRRFTRLPSPVCQGPGHRAGRRRPVGAARNRTRGHTGTRRKLPGPPVRKRRRRIPYHHRQDHGRRDCRKPDRRNARTLPAYLQLRPGLPREHRPAIPGPRSAHGRRSRPRCRRIRPAPARHRRCRDPAGSRRNRGRPNRQRSHRRTPPPGAPANHPPR